MIIFPNKKSLHTSLSHWVWECYQASCHRYYFKLTVICALMEIAFTNKIILSYNSKLKGMIQRINPFTFITHSFHEMACPSIDMGQNTTMPLLVVNYVQILFQKSFQLKSSVCFETNFRTKSKPRSTNIKLPILTK